MRNFIFCTVYLIVRVINYGRLRWASHKDKMEEGSGAFKILTHICTEILIYNVINNISSLFV